MPGIHRCISIGLFQRARIHYYTHQPTSSYSIFFWVLIKKIRLLNGNKIVKLFFFFKAGKQGTANNCKLSVLWGQVTLLVPPHAAPTLSEFSRNDVTCYYENPTASTRPWQAHNEEVTQLLF